MATIAKAPGSDTALLTEHFGYPPVSLLDDIINSINILAERALNSVEQGLLAQPPANLGFRPQSQAQQQQQQAASSKTRSRGGKKGGSNGNGNGNNNQEQTPADPEEAARHEIENGTHQLETLLCASIDRNFDKFELYVLRNILCVRLDEHRDWIRLSHYDGLDFDAAARLRASASASAPASASKPSSPSPPPLDPNTPSVDGVRHLRRRLQASQKLNCMLHVERARNERLLESLRAIVGGAAAATNSSKKNNNNNNNNNNGDGSAKEAAEPQSNAQAAPSPFGFLHDKRGLTEGDAKTPLTTTTAFTLSQLQALRALSTSLRNVLPDLGGVEDEGYSVLGQDAGGSEGPKSWRRQRLEYVETATKKHLENARGLELGKDGEVIDGEWQGGGRNLGKGEVEGLERAIGLLESGKASTDEMDES